MAYLFTITFNHAVSFAVLCGLVEAFQWALTVYGKGSIKGRYQAGQVYEEGQNVAEGPSALLVVLDDAAKNCTGGQGIKTTINTAWWKRSINNGFKSTSKAENITDCKGAIAAGIRKIADISAIVREVPQTRHCSAGTTKQVDAMFSQFPLQSFKPLSNNDPSTVQAAIDLPEQQGSNTSAVDAEPDILVANNEPAAAAAAAEPPNPAAAAGSSAAAAAGAEPFNPDAAEPDDTETVSENAADAVTPCATRAAAKRRAEGTTTRTAQSKRRQRTELATMQEQLASLTRQVEEQKAINAQQKAINEQQETFNKQTRAVLDEHNRSMDELKVTAKDTNEGVRRLVAAAELNNASAPQAAGAGHFIGAVNPMATYQMGPLNAAGGGHPVAHMTHTGPLNAAGGGHPVAHMAHTGPLNAAGGGHPVAHMAHTGPLNAAGGGHPVAHMAQMGPGIYAAGIGYETPMGPNAAGAAQPAGSGIQGGMVGPTGEQDYLVQAWDAHLAGFNIGTPGSSFNLSDILGSNMDEINEEEARAIQG